MTLAHADSNYQCADCLRITDTPIEHHVREFDGLDCGPYRYSVELECPHCNGYELTEVEMCPTCGVEPVDEEFDLCSDCAQKEINSSRLTDVIKDIAMTPVTTQGTKLK